MLQLAFRGFTSRRDKNIPQKGKVVNYLNAFSLHKEVAVYFR